MASKRNLLLFLLWITLHTKAEAATTSSTTTVAGSSSNLSCYDCSEAFKYVWEPYTECQYYPKNAPLRPCLDIERYCKIERVTYKSVTVSITRGCTKECWHGCYAYGFGLTRLRCTSCCLTPGCNVGDTGNTLHTKLYTDYLVLASWILFVMDLCSL